jgi:hypothetical protein
MTGYIAQKFVAPSPDAEVLGQILQIFTINMYAEDIQPILHKNNVSEFDFTRWYSMQLVLDILKDIYESDSHVTEKLVAISMMSAANLPEGQTVRSALEMVNQRMWQSSRNIPEGFGTSVRSLSEKHLQLFYNAPYPEHATYGYIWGIVNRFKPTNDVFVVRIIDNLNDATHPGICFDVKWGLSPQEVE